MIELVHGNLFDANVEALVNTVNCIGVMGKGVALQFKRAFPENYRAYRAACQRGDVRLGEVFVFDAGGIAGGARYIVNFPTKRHWRNRSRLEDIETGLGSLVEAIRQHGIRSIAIPPLGCGNGGLAWPAVRTRIESAFADLEPVRTLLYAPGGCPPATAQPTRTPRPTLTPGRASLLALMNRYFVPGYLYPLSLLEVQKLAYFLQESGQRLRLRFSAGWYGPYADNLRHVLERLEGHYIEGVGTDGDRPSTPISLLPHAAEEAEKLLALDHAVQRRFDRVARLIEGFETPHGMELLASVHWVTRHHPPALASSEAAIERIHSWTQRKARTLRPAHIRAAWQRLCDQGWLGAGPSAA